MDFQSKLPVFLVFSVVLAIVGQTWRVNAVPVDLDADREMFVQFDNVLSGLAQSVSETHDDVRTGISEGEEDMDELVNSQTRMTYEVKVMELEHEAEILSGKRTADSALKGKQITEAKENLTGTLAPKIEEVTQDLVDLNTTMGKLSLNSKELEQLIKKANSNLTEEEQIVLPTSGEMLSNVKAEIDKVDPIFQRRASAEQLIIIEKQLKSIRTNFNKLLTDKSQEENLEDMTGLSDEIHASLAQIRQLDLFDPQAKMEL